MKSIGKTKLALQTAGMYLKGKALILFVLALMIILPIFTRMVIWQLPVPGPALTEVNDEMLKAAQDRIEREISSFDRMIQAKRPRSYFLVINSASNEFALYKGNTLIREGQCSTGSYILLKNGEEQQWMFKTPKGEFRIQGKTTSPVWKKPDWAFIEEGLPVPTANHYSRFEYGVLGDYALSLGDGYLIHGTLFQRFLGLPVTHGCIRLNDENLELIYHSLQVGSKVNIF